MTKGEFLDKLKAALENDLDARDVQENMDYYKGYIKEELAKGRSEQEVIDELGDPWVIAQSVIDMEENNLTAKEGFRETGSGEERQQAEAEREPQIHSYRIDSWWKKLLLVLGMIGVLVLVVSVVGGLITFFMPLILFFVVITFVINFIKKFR